MAPSWLARTWRRARRRWSAREVDVVWGRRYRLELPVTPFDGRRPDRILSFLSREGLVRRRELHRARPAPFAALGRVHEADYLEALQDPDALTGVLGTSVSDEEQEAYLLSHREQVGGTCLAARLALTHGGVAVNLGGGFHHALAGRGQGFCVFHDVGVAIAERRKAGFDGPVLVVDLDLHDGDGTRALFAADPTVHTLSIHNRDLAPTAAVESTSLALGSGVDDATYLDAVRASVPPVLERMRPALAFYLAGVDPWRDDALGDWRVSAEALVERDRLVLGWLRSPTRPVPTVVLLAGGYGRHSWRLSARSVAALFVPGAPPEPPATVELALRHFRRVARLLPASELTRAPTSDDWELEPADVDPAAGRWTRRTRFLDYYSRHGLELALDRYGVIERLRELGYPDVGLEVRLDDEVHTLRLRREEDGTPLVELSVRRDATAIPGATMLSIEWLLLQNPLARFTPERARLPGQTHPGLHMLSDVMTLLVLACERLGLDGISIVPSHYHVAALAHPSFRFVEAGDEARFVGLSRALAPYRLAEAVRLLDAGRVRDGNGAAVAWKPARMALPARPALRVRIDDPERARDVERLVATFAFRVVPPDAG